VATDWAEVINNFIKIGIPAICTAATAVLVTRFAQTHDIEKERRRRRQDFLLKAADELDRLKLSVTEALSLRGVVRELKKTGAGEERITNVIVSLLKQIDSVEAAESRFGRLETQFELFAFSRCSKAFSAYGNATMHLKKAITKMDDDPEEKGAIEKWWAAEIDFRDELASAFKKL
jgi:hypothetical protein